MRLILLGLLVGATNSSSPAPLSPSASVTPHAPEFREVAPGILEYHGIRLNPKNHRISFPGIVNQTQGLIEYLLVNEKGKVHESLLATTITPHDIHLALLLIGLKENKDSPNAKATVPPMAIDSAYLSAEPKLAGVPVALTVSWTQAGKSRKVPAEDWIFNLQTNRPMTEGTWTYNGSLVEDGVFLADQELSIISVITDPTALVNNSRPGYDNDEIWQVSDSGVPPENTPVEISMTLMELPRAAK